MTSSFAKPPAKTETGFTVSEALVLRTESGFCTVLTDSGDRIQINQGKKIRTGTRTSTTSVVIGDRVSIRLEPLGAGGVVEAVLERRNQLYRLAPGRSSMKDVLAANLDSLVIVQSLHFPDFAPARLDRFLAIAEQGEIPASIVLNKVDLATATEAQSIAVNYRKAGYTVVISSARTAEGIMAVRDLIRGISAFVGPSGVGKSSLLNRIRPDLHLRTGEVNEVTGKGKHTTVVSELLDLGNGDYIAGHARSPFNQLGRHRPL